MKREIKFRAYSDSSNKMMDWDFIKSVGNLTKLICLNHVNVMQYIGTKDKNNKDVYEGDYIKIYWTTNDPTVEIISYDNENCYWKYGNAPMCELTEIHNNFEVIGNVFENPEHISEDALRFNADIPDETEDEDFGMFHNCPNCNREYDAVDFEYQICHHCKHNASHTGA